MLRPYCCFGGARTLNCCLQTLVSVLTWQLIPAASFFRVGVEVVSAAMLCSQAHFLTRCWRNYFSGRDTGLGLAVGLHSCDNVWPLSERVRSSYRTLRTACPFRAHFNLWWARHGWPLIHLVSRPDGYFSRPPYFTAGVNLTAEFPSEPPRGGEHGAGENCLNRNSPFAKSRNCLDNGMRPVLTT